MKKRMIVLLALLMMMPAMALGQNAALLVELEQDAQMIENIAFEDGDFIQTYQLSGGASGATSRCSV